MKAILTLLCLSALLLTASAYAATSDLPLFSAKRAALAVGGEYAFYSGQDAPALNFKKEWQAGIFGGYKLTPTTSLTASLRYGVDTKQFETKVGLRLIVWDGAK